MATKRKKSNRRKLNLGGSIEEILRKSGLDQYIIDDTYPYDSHLMGGAGSGTFQTKTAPSGKQSPGGASMPGWVGAVQQIGGTVGKALSSAIDVGIPAINALIQEDPGTRRQKDIMAYNPYPQGTGSQAIYRHGGEVPEYRNGGYTTTYRKRGGMTITEEIPMEINSFKKNALNTDLGFNPIPIEVPKPVIDDLKTIQFEKLRDASGREMYSPIARGYNNRREYLRDVQNLPDTLGPNNIPVNKSLDFLFTDSRRNPNPSTWTPNYGSNNPLYTLREGGTVEAIGPNTIEFRGPSHEQGGIPISYSGNTVEVEGGETAFVDDDQSLVVLGNLKVPGTNIKFKNAGKKLAKEEKASMKMLEDSLEIINSSDPYTTFGTIAFSSARANKDAATQKLKSIHDTKQKLGDLQEALLTISEHTGISPEKTIKYFNKGGKIKDSNDMEAFLQNIGTASQPIIDFADDQRKLQSGGTVGASNRSGGVLTRDEIENIAIEEASNVGVDPALFLALIGQESKYNPQAKSHKGARGLVQLMPATAKSLGITSKELNSSDPKNIRKVVNAGAQYLKQQLDAHNGDEILALASYNAGPSAIKGVIGRTAKEFGVNPKEVTGDHVLKYWEVELERNPTKDRNKYRTQTYDYINKIQGRLEETNSRLRDRERNAFEENLMKEVPYVLPDNTSVSNPINIVDYDPESIDQPQSFRKGGKLSKLKNGDKLSKNDLIKMVEEEADAVGIDANILLSLVNAESGFRPEVVSSKGAKGLMQLMPATAKSLGISEKELNSSKLGDIRKTINAGARYLKQQIDTFGDLILGIAAYNAGPGGVRSALNGASRMFRKPPDKITGNELLEYWRSEQERNPAKNKHAHRVETLNYVNRIINNTPLSSSRPISDEDANRNVQRAKFFLDNPGVNPFSLGFDRGTSGTERLPDNILEDIQVPLESSPPSPTRNIPGMHMLDPVDIIGKKPEDTSGYLYPLSPRYLGVDSIAGMYTPSEREVPAPIKKEKKEPKDEKSLADSNKLKLEDFLGEMMALSQSADPVQSFQYTPNLAVPYSISLQDQLNKNQETFRTIARQVTNNPQALSELAAQKYRADQEVLSKEFTTNQQIANTVANQNLGILNDAQLKNIAMDDTQYSRQAQAEANTRAQKRAALNSISNKIAQNRKENLSIRMWENMFDYRPDENMKLTYQGDDHTFIQPMKLMYPGHDFNFVQPEIKRNGSKLRRTKK